MRTNKVICTFVKLIRIYKNTMFNTRWIYRNVLGLTSLTKHIKTNTLRYLITIIIIIRCYFSLSDRTRLTVVKVTFWRLRESTFETQIAIEERRVSTAVSLRRRANQHESTARLAERTYRNIRKSLFKKRTLYYLWYVYWREFNLRIVNDNVKNSCEEKFFS